MSDVDALLERAARCSEAVQTIIAEQEAMMLETKRLIDSVRAGQPNNLSTPPPQEFAKSA